MYLLLKPIEIEPVFSLLFQAISLIYYLFQPLSAVFTRLIFHNANFPRDSSLKVEPGHLPRHYVQVYFLEHKEFIQSYRTNINSHLSLSLSVMD